MKNVKQNYIFSKNTKKYEKYLQQFKKNVIVINLLITACEKTFKLS